MNALTTMPHFMYIYIYVWGVSLVILEFVRQMVLLLASVLCEVVLVFTCTLIIIELLYDYECRAVHDSEHHA